MRNNQQFKQIIKAYEDYIGDHKMKHDILNKVCGGNLAEETCSEKRFIKIILSTDLI